MEQVSEVTKQPLSRKLSYQAFNSSLGPSSTPVHWFHTATTDD